MNIHRGVVLVVWVLGGFSTALAQVEVGVQFQGGFPQGTLKSNVNEVGYGIEGTYGYHIPSTPFVLGINLGYLDYGRYSRPEKYSSNISQELDIIHNLYTGHFLFRIQAGKQGINPYLDGLVGGNYFITQSRVEGDGREVSARFDDAALSYGMGGGIKIKISQTEEWVPIQSSRWYLDLKVRYLFSERARFLKEGSLLRQNNRLSYENSFAKTDLVTFSLGLLVEVF